jgi:hypothetical protein
MPRRESLIAKVSNHRRGRLSSFDFGLIDYLEALKDIQEDLLKIARVEGIQAAKFRLYEMKKSGWFLTILKALGE